MVCPPPPPRRGGGGTGFQIGGKPDKTEGFCAARYMPQDYQCDVGGALSQIMCKHSPGVVLLWQAPGL
jgi:hypothetical protein